MTFIELMTSLIFVAIPLGLALFLKLGLERDILIATVRSIVQLLIIGYILTFVFESDSPVFMLLIIPGSWTSPIVFCASTVGIMLVRMALFKLRSIAAFGVPPNDKMSSITSSLRSTSSLNLFKNRSDNTIQFPMTIPLIGMTFSGSNGMMPSPSMRPIVSVSTVTSVSRIIHVCKEIKPVSPKGDQP